MLTRHWKVIGAVAVALVWIAGAAVFFLDGSGRASAPPDMAAATLAGAPGPEGVPLEVGPLLAPAASASTGRPVDGIGCDAGEQVAYHVHTHLAVYVDGVLRPLPAGIGLVAPIEQQTVDGPFDAATRCYYWLHVHAQDGVIHIESPTKSTYTLGELFDLWQQPLSTGQVGPVVGQVTLYVNGQQYSANPRDVALGSHEDIQIDVGTHPVAPQRVDWAKTRL